MEKFNLYYHGEKSRGLAEFLKKFSALTNYSINVNIKSLPNGNSGKEFALLPRSLRKLLFFGHPDVILTYDNGIESEKTIFAWEITDAKPATDHWMQRFPSLVGACELGIPSVFIMRYESDTNKWKGKLNSEFFYAYDRVMEIQEIPIYLADWCPNEKGELSADKDYPDVPDRDSFSMKDTIKFLNTTIDYAIHGKDFKNLIKERLIVDLRNKHRIKISEIPHPGNYNRLKHLSNEGYVDWQTVVNYIENEKKLKIPSLPERIPLRNKSLVFLPRLTKTNRVLKETLMDRIHKKNGNPYNGMPLAFDFLFCRLGTTTYDRDVNLLIDLSELSFEEFSVYARKVHDSSPIGKNTLPKESEIPKYSLHLTEGYTHEIKDFIRQYCYAADIIILKDIVIPFR
ncbi:hypothetical protein ABS768_06845 [Flavobacterium sp. ST-75]|uniref:Uncharacterized protein n=1 Tax=Flavobacterium rhizophilum TaxID=3163296 RepID=A0ABW8YAG2_9FLAO